LRSRSHPGFGRRLQIAEGGAVVFDEFPSGWKVEKSDESLDASSKDEEIYINVEVNDSDSSRAGSTNPSVT